MKNYYKKGSYVRYEHIERRKNAWGDYYDSKEYTPAIVVENPRDEYGRFTSDFRLEEDVNVKIKLESGEILNATLEEVCPDVAPGSLSIEELKKLRRQICGGSMYISDYNNTLGVFNETAYDYYEGFWEYLCEEYGDSAEEHDTQEEFAEYCYGIEYYRPSSLSA